MQYNAPPIAGRFAWCKEELFTKQGGGQIPLAGVGQ